MPPSPGSKPRLAVMHGPEIAPGEPGAERSATTRRWSWRRACARRCARLNPALPAEALEDAFRKLTRPEGADACRAQPRAASAAGRRRDGRVPRAGRLDSRGAGARHRLRRSRQQRLAGGQPVHRHRGQAQPPAGRRAVRQRPAAGGDRAEERRRRGRDDLDGVPPAPDLQGARSRRSSRTTRCWSSPTASGAHRHARRRAGNGSSPGARSTGETLRRPRPARAAGRARGRVRASAGSSTWSAHFIVFEDDGGGKLAKKMAGYHQFHAVQRGGGGDAARGASWPRRRLRSRRAATRRASSRAASRATGASAWSGTRRARARA